MNEEEIVGYHCTNCGIWYDTTDIYQCVRCKEYKGLVPVTKREWNIDWDIDNIGI